MEEPSREYPSSSLPKCPYEKMQRKAVNDARLEEIKCTESSGILFFYKGHYWDKEENL
jgi:hypothetical protein